MWNIIQHEFLLSAGVVTGDPALQGTGGAIRRFLSLCVQKPELVPVFKLWFICLQTAFCGA